MNHFWKLALVSLVTTMAYLGPANAAVTATKGEMLHDSIGGPIADVSEVNSDGSVAILYDDRVITVPSNTLSMVDGKLETNLTKDQVELLK